MASFPFTPSGSRQDFFSLMSCGNLVELPEVNFTVRACLRAIAGLVPDRGNEASCNRLAGGGFGLKSVF